MDVRFDPTRPRAWLAELSARVAPRPPAPVRLDLSALTTLDDLGAATVRTAVHRLTAAGVAVEVVGASPPVVRALARGAHPPTEAAAAPGLLQRLGQTCVAAYDRLVGLADLCFATVRAVASGLVGHRTFTWGDVADQMERMGADSMLIASSLSFLLGLVLAFQTWLQLHSFGTEQYVLEFVAIGMARGFAPFIVAILLAGRTGSAIATELATMEMRQENDVLRVMGISPVQHLVAPRFIAMTIVAPGLALVAAAAGIAGAFVVTVALEADWASGARSAVDAIAFSDFWLGIVKSDLFGWVIVFASAFTGFHSGYGPLSVGKAATRAVVASIFFIMIVDAIVTTAWTVAQ